MSTQPRCSFCETLPLHSGRWLRTTTSARCPLCKGELRVDRSAGVMYRYEPPGEAAVAGPRRSLRTAGMLAGLLVLGLLGAASRFVHDPPPTEPTATPVVVAAVEATPAPSRSVEREISLPSEARDTPEKEPAATEAETVVAALPRPPADPTPVVEPPPAPAEPATSVAPAPTAPPPSRWRRSYTAEELAGMLRQVPEVSLRGPSGAKDLSGWNDLQKAINQHGEQLHNHLVAERPDLADLPFVGAEYCRLGPTAARELEACSRLIRQAVASALGEPIRPLRPAAPAQRTGSAGPGEGMRGTPSTTSYLSYQLAEHLRAASPNVLPTLEQILSGEPAPVRMALTGYLHCPPDSPVAAAILARRALFDTSAELREEALVGLRFLQPADYVPLLLGGLRHPWAPANFHAAEALVALRARKAVPELVRLLDAPDPCAPFEVERGGRKTLAVRELVRVNHHANCLLCHAPSFDRSDPARARAPDPSQPLPPRFSLAYYSPGSGPFVRADITYLRQDFSEVQAVEDPGPWPKEQRFDFLVRVRPLSEDETAARRRAQQLAGPPPLPASRQAVLFALEELAGGTPCVGSGDCAPAD